MKRQKFYVYFSDGTECEIETAGMKSDSHTADFYKAQDQDGGLLGHIVTANWNQVKCISLEPLTFTTSNDDGG